jgi:cysteine desulfurase/selenocysteine lyase
MTATELPHAALRADFPVLARTVDGVGVNYLDSAATSLKPQSVVDAMVRYYTQVGANIHRGKHMLSEEASQDYESARLAVAELIGAAGPGVVFTANTTHGVNMLASGLDLPDDPLFLVSADAHHSQQLPWRRRGRVEWIEVDEDGRVDLDRYRELLAHQPDLVALNHCSNVTGRYAPAARMTEMAHTAGAFVVLDAAQSVAHRPKEVAATGADALVFSGHKMLGPTGIGVLAMTSAMMERLTRPPLGGGTVDWVGLDEFRLRRAPYRFEAGTPHIAGAYGLAAAVNYLTSYGLTDLEQHDRQLAELLYTEAAARPYLTVVGGGDADRAGILSVTVRGCPDLGDLARVLSDSYGVMCRTGHMCAQPLVDRAGGGQVLRVSAYLYNSPHDIKAAFEALDEAYPLVREASA